MNFFPIIQYILSAATIIVGLINFFRSSDIVAVKISGFISILLGLFFSLVLFFQFPLAIREHSSNLYVLSTLSINVFFIWSLFSGMLPIISMQPTWFNFKNVFRSIHPLLIILFITCINKYFVLEETTFMNISSQSIENTNKPDFIIRIIWFFATITYSIWHIYRPFSFIPKTHTRKPTRFLYYHQILLLFALISFVLTVKGGVWTNIYQTTLILVTLTSSVSFFWKDAFSVVRKKQLSLNTADEPEDVHLLNLDIAAKQLRLERASQMLELFKTKDLLSNPKFSLQELSDLMKLDKSTTQDIILLLGYAGFLEMVNNLRCDKFKQMANNQLKQGHQPNIMDIMYKVGFVSYESFSKLFTNLNESSPEQYVELLKAHIK